MSGNCAHEGGQIVSTFKNADQSAFSVSIGYFQAEARDVGEVVVGEPQATNGIVTMAVESGREKHDLGFELNHRGDEFLSQSPENLLPSCSLRNGTVHGCSFAWAATRLLPSTCPRIEWRLMRAEVEDGRILVERLLRPVSMVDIPVDDCHPFKVVFSLYIAGGDGHVVEYTEAHSPSWGCMVTGWSDGAECEVRTAGEHGVRGFQYKTYRGDRCIP